MTQKINRCLNPQLIKLCQQVIQLDELDNRIKAYLPSPLVNYCQAAGFNHGCLLISTPNAWATELRFRLPELRDQLRKGGLFQLRSIKMVIAEKASPSLFNKNSHKLDLSKTARLSLNRAGELCTYPPLKEALYHFANRNLNLERVNKN